MRVRLPLTVDPGPDGEYADLRVVDDRGAETPYAIDPQHAPPDGLRAVRMVDTGFVPHRYSQAVLDLGNDPADTVILQVDAPKLPTYLERVTIEASDDRHVWRIVRDGAIVYYVAEDGGRGNQTVRFPESASRWLRVRIADPQRPFPMSGALVSDTHGAQPAAPALAPLAVAAVAGTEPRRTGKCGRSRTAASRCARRRSRSPTAARRSRATRSWSRATTTARPGRRPRTARSRALPKAARRRRSRSASRARGAGASSSRTANDAPVRGLRPALLARPRDVVFEAAPQRRYRLLSGNELASRPTYDLGTRLAHSAWRADPAFAVPTRRNAAYADERPGTERAPGALTGVLLAVAVALGALAVLTMRGAKNA